MLKLFLALETFGREICMKNTGIHAIIIIQHNSLIDAAIVQPSALEQICGQPALIYTTKLLASLEIPTTVVLDAHSNQRDAQAVETALRQYHGDTVKIDKALPTTSGEDLLILKGALPLLSAEIVTRLHAEHTATQAALSIITAYNEDPKLIGYERNSYTTIDQELYCVNAGIVLIQRSFLEQCGAELATHSVEDLVKKADAVGKKVTKFAVPFDAIRRINTFQDLWAIEHIQRSALITQWMHKGVRFAAPHTVHVDVAVTIGKGSHIGTGVHLFGTTTIGTNCQIHEFSSLDHATLGNNSTVYSHSVIRKSSIGAQAMIGPFAHLNGDNAVGDQATIGNFVEIKRSTIGTKTKVKHLSYLGDAQLGTGVNIGAGTITCNHDGFNKHTTIIEDNAYIGTNTTLVAPLTIGHDAFSAAGSTITKNIPSFALAIARTRQTNKEGYVHLLREKKATIKAQITTDQASFSENAGQTTSFIGAVKPSPKTTPTKI